MSKTYYEVRAKFVRRSTGEKVCELFLVDAPTFASAELCVTEHYDDDSDVDELRCVALKEVALENVFMDFNKDLKWWKVKVGFQEVNETTGKVKVTPAY